VKRRAWKIVLGVLGVVVLILGGIVADGHRRAAVLIDRERVAVQAGLAAMRARDPRRPSMSKDPIDGNAWDYYGPALTAIAAIPDEVADPLSGFNDAMEEVPPDDHAIHNLVREHQGDLDRLHQGARCRSAELPYFVDPHAPLPLATEIIRTKRFLWGLAAHELRMGHDEEALRTAATGLAVGQDYGRGGTLVTALIQQVCEGVLLDALKQMFGEHAFPPATLAEFAETLNRLDVTRPDFLDSWKGEELFEKNLLIDQPWDDLFNSAAGLPLTTKRKHVWPSWRALYSERICRAQALGRVNECFRQLEELKLLPPWDRVVHANRIDEGNHLTTGTSSSGNVLVDSMIPSFAPPFRRDATTQLGWLLLHVSVAIARFDGDQGRLPARLDELVPKYLPKLSVCPLTGTPLRYKDGKVWSVGRNLVDDGGVEDVSGSDDGGENGDVVWTVKGRK
jgi:hypothetical protein